MTELCQEPIGVQPGGSDLTANGGAITATLHRRKVAGRFTLDESNRLYWLESLLDLADRVLEDSEETKVFMTTGNLALGGAIPLDYARTAPGLEAVRRLLLQLDYGVIV